MLPVRGEKKESKNQHLGGREKQADRRGIKCG